jgi:hypothetical protein
MRQPISLFLFCGICLFFVQCSGQAKTAIEAQKLANEISDKTAIPGESPTGNIYMKAIINGKPWTASKLIRDNSIGSNNYRVTGTGNGTTIGFYVYLPHLKAGDDARFYEGNVADFITDDENVFYGGSTGKFVVTKVDNQGFEGIFYFTASSKDVSKKFEVTGGSLRFPWPKKQ